MKIGYARVSTTGQTLDMQMDALKLYGCETIYADHGESGRKGSRPELDKCMASLQRGDILVVYKLDRLFRSVVHFAKAWADFKSRGIELASITQGFDTSSSSGRLMMNILSSFAEFESDIISERTSAGIQAVVSRGKEWNACKIIPEGQPVSRRTYYRRKAQLKMLESQSASCGTGGK
jgi:DNA invertase Pin-like site-specific DNA recombinase